jgi:hypothetical protein
MIESRHTEALKDLRASWDQMYQGSWTQVLWISTSLILAHGSALILIFQAILGGRICDFSMFAALPWTFILGLAFAILGIAFWYFIGKRASRIIRARISTHIKMVHPSDDTEIAAKEDLRLEGELRAIGSLFPIHAFLLIASTCLLLMGVILPLVCPGIASAICPNQR